MFVTTVAVVPVTDFDFLQDPWVIANVLFRDGVESRFEGDHSGVVKHLGGFVNTDVTHFRPPAPSAAFSGMSLRLLDPVRECWSIYWIGTGITLSDPVHGVFDGARGEFSSAPERGSDTIWRFLWTEVDTPRPHWEQGYSKDGGDSWVVDWTMDFRRP
jgi:hypothetical protein